MLLKAIFSDTWENIDQNFYTKMAQCIDPVDSTITFFAEILSSGQLRAFNDKGEDVTDSDSLVKLLLNPNENQNFKEFIKEWLYYHYAHGWNYIVPVSTSAGFEKQISRSDTTTRLYNCDPDNITWRDGFLDAFVNFLNGDNRKKISFNYKPLGFTDINYKDVISFVDVRRNPVKPWMGISRLLALKQQIQNFSIALQAKENMLKRSGSQLVALDGKTEDMGLDATVGTGQFDKDDNPILTTYKDKLENQIRETGIANDSMGIIFANLPLKVQSLSAGLEKIKYDEMAMQDTRTILNKFNVPKEFQNLSVNDVAKYDEQNSSMKSMIQNIMEPLGNSFCDKNRTYFNHPNKLVIDFSHLPVFSDNEKTRTETQQAIVDMYLGLFEKNAITLQQLTQILEENGIIVTKKKTA